MSPTAVEHTLEVVVLRSPLQRLRGLLGRQKPPPGRGVCLEPCRQIHTLFMAYAIDVLHLDADGVVLAVATLRPFRLGRWLCRGRVVVELAAGEAARLGIETGHRVRLIAIEWPCYPLHSEGVPLRAESMTEQVP